MTDTIAPSLRHGDQSNKPPYDLNEAATKLVLTYGPLILRDARRYSSCAPDAEDAYQRALEILLTKAPSDEVDVIEMPLPDLWGCFKDAACITRSDFDAYFEGKDVGTAIKLEDVDIWPESVAMSVVQAELEISPVQGWRYIAPEVTDALALRGSCPASMRPNHDMQPRCDAAVV